MVNMGVLLLMPNSWSDAILNPENPFEDEYEDIIGGDDLPPCEGEIWYDQETGQYFSGAGSFFDEPCDPNINDWSYGGKMNKRGQRVFVEDYGSIFLLGFLSYWIIK